MPLPRAGSLMMELRKVNLERYKGYAEPTEIEIAPLTILVGANDSGKTALAQAIQLLAGGLAPSEQDMAEPLPLESGGIRHGLTFRDLVSGRAVHGWLRLSAAYSNHGRELSLDATIRNVESPDRPPQRQISNWNMRCDTHEVALAREGLDAGSPYRIHVQNTEISPRQVEWRGLLPRHPNEFAEWMEAAAGDLKSWTAGVRHLRCPRHFQTGPLSMPERSPVHLGPHGEDTPLALAADGELREAIADWYRSVFGVTLDVVGVGGYFELHVRALDRDANVRLVQSGRGLSHVLPVAVTALSARNAGSGVDIVEHPEAELHPAAHAHVAELLLDNLAGPARPMIIETHSEMVLLRARRWIAEGKLPAANVLVYWIEAEPGRGSTLGKITIDERGEMDSWPEGVFIEDYEEILAIRRANRPTEQRNN